MKPSKLRNIHTFTVYGGFYAIFICVIMALFFPTNLSGDVFIMASIAVLPCMIEYIHFPFEKMVKNEIFYKGEKEIKNKIEKEEESLSAPGWLWASLLIFSLSKLDDNCISSYFIILSIIPFIIAFKRLFSYLATESKVC